MLFSRKRKSLVYLSNTIQYIKKKSSNLTVLKCTFYLQYTFRIFRLLKVSKILKILKVLKESNLQKLL